MNNQQPKKTTSSRRPVRKAPMGGQEAPKKRIAPAERERAGSEKTVSPRPHGSRQDTAQKPSAGQARPASQDAVRRDLRSAQMRYASPERASNHTTAGAKQGQRPSSARVRSENGQVQGQSTPKRDRNMGVAPTQRRMTVSRIHIPPIVWPILLVLIALSLVGLTVLGVYTAGYRYVTREQADGEEIKFYGKVDGDGEALEGKIYFPDGMTAKVAGALVTYSNGDVYEGEMVGLLRNGTGKMTYANGDVYEGVFVNGSITGKGKFTYAGGDVYEGDFVDGKKHGKGKCIFSSGDTYEGDFVNDRKTGMGKFVYASGGSYEGGYYRDTKHGKGTYTWANGEVYVGDFVQDVRTGQGTYTWANGDKYEGAFVNNLMNGKGTYTWASGRSYTGMFENGKIVYTEVE